MTHKYHLAITFWCISLHPWGGEDAYDDEDDSSCEEEDDGKDDSHDQEDNDDGISEEDGEEDEEVKEEFRSKREEGQHVCIVLMCSTSSSCLTLLHCNVHGTWTLWTSPENATTASHTILSIDAHAVSLFDTATYHARVLHQKYRGMFDTVRGDDKGVVDDFLVSKAWNSLKRRESILILMVRFTLIISTFRALQKAVATVAVERARNIHNDGPPIDTDTLE